MRVLSFSARTIRMRMYRVEKRVWEEFIIQGNYITILVTANLLKFTTMACRASR